MARSKNNIATEGMSGKIGPFVFRQRNGKTIVGKTPLTSGSASAAQLQVRELFRQAVVYAKAALADAATRLFYQSKAGRDQTPYNMALADFFKAPQISAIDVSAYDGAAGSFIMIAASDDGKVTAVTVKIQKGDGSLLEEGSAVLQSDGLHWRYSATASNAAPAGSLITITAVDLPGHASVKQISL